MQNKDKTTSQYHICSHCIMDNMNDDDITFNNSGVCNYCLHYEKTIPKNEWNSSEEKENKLIEILNQIKKIGKGKTYDCILGVSGGVDSTYVAYLAKKFALKPLIVHYDNGWNSELAVKNIENIVKKLRFDLYTYVNDWEEFKALQLAFLKASVIDIELLTDQAISATLYKMARKHKIKYIILGVNHSTEAILPPHWYHWKGDTLNIKSIYKKFGKLKIKTYPYLNFFDKLFFDKFLKIKCILLLDYVEYHKEKAKQIIVRELNWRDYGGKHHESMFTKFYQSYILPKKFGIDKRKAHLSTLICSGQISREEALEEIRKPIYPSEQLKQDKEYVIKKLGITPEEFEFIMNQSPKKHTDYPSYLTRHYKYQNYVSKYFIRPLKKILKTKMFSG